MSLLVDHLHKRFGAVVALDDLAFEVPTGQVFGFLGANGVQVRGGTAYLLSAACSTAADPNLLPAELR